jgi:hypothetical protein
MLILEVKKMIKIVTIMDWSYKENLQLCRLKKGPIQEPLMNLKIILIYQDSKASKKEHQGQDLHHQNCQDKLGKF